MSPDTITQLKIERDLLLRMVDAVDLLLNFRSPDPCELTPDRPNVVCPTPPPPPTAPPPEPTPPKPRVIRPIRPIRPSTAGTHMAAALETLDAMTGVFSTEDFHTALSSRVPNLRPKRTSDILYALCRKKRVVKRGRGQFERTAAASKPSTSPAGRPPGISTRVLEACRALGRPAPRPDIIHWLTERYPDETGRFDNLAVDKALWSLRESKALVVIGEVQGIAGPLKLHAIA